MKIGDSTRWLAWRDRLAREGRLRLGTQDWSTMRISKLDRPIDIQASLRAVREDPSEARQRRLTVDLRDSSDEGR